MVSLYNRDTCGCIVHGKVAAYSDYIICLLYDDTDMSYGDINSRNEVERKRYVKIFAVMHLLLFFVLFCIIVIVVAFTPKPGCSLYIDK